MMNYWQKGKYLLFALALTSLTSCSVYSTGFTCPDAKGARCMMLSGVDQQVTSGEIETVYLSKCRAGKCPARNDTPARQVATGEVKVILVEDGGGEHE
jgi:hypothetical protein